MPEPDLIQRQREILYTFRQATTQRAKVEAGAEAQRRTEHETADKLLHKAQQEAQTQRTKAEANAGAMRKSEQQAAGTALSQAQQTAITQLAKARKALETAQAALAKAGLQRMLDQTTPASTTASPGADPTQELVHCVSVATKVSTSILGAVESWQRWHKAAASRRRLLAGFAVVVLLVLATAVFLRYRAWQTEQQLEQHYSSAVVALETEHWDTAQAELQQLLSTDSEYRDAQTLLRESYYQPAVAALEGQMWDTAAEAIIELNKLDPAYRDITGLVATHLELRQALAISYWLKGNIAATHTFSGHEDSVIGVAFSPDGSTLVAGVHDDWEHVKLWDVIDRQEVRTFGRSIFGGWCTLLSVAFSSDGQTLAAGCTNDEVRIWNVTGADEVRIFGHGSDVLTVAFSPDGQMLASAGHMVRVHYFRNIYHAEVKLWDVASGQEVHTFTGHEDSVRSVAFSPDGQTLASGSQDKTVKLWNVASRHEDRTLRGHGDAVLSVTFSPIGRILASGSTDGTVKLWDVASGQEVHTFTGHEDAVMSVAFSPEGRVLASGSKDDTVKLWDVVSGREVHTLSGHDNDVWSVAFSPDGKTLASGAADKTVKLWRGR